MKNNFMLKTVRNFIGENDPPTFTLFNVNGKSPVLLVCDHASNIFPLSMGDFGLKQKDMRRHIAWDIGAKNVTQIISKKLDAPAILAGYSRLVIDLNRKLGDPESIPEVSDSTSIVGNLKLTKKQKKEREEIFFWPYHKGISNFLKLMKTRGIVPIVFSVHSFTPYLGKNKRKWHVSVLWNRDPRIAIPLLDRLNSQSGPHFLVGDNEPYSGRDTAFTIDFHAGAKGLPNCAIEIRQNLINTPKGAKKWASILADALSEIIKNEDLRVIKRY